MAQHFTCAVFIDGRPISTETVSASSPATAAARALRDALRLKRHRSRPAEFTVKLRKLAAVSGAPSADQPKE